MRKSILLTSLLAACLVSPWAWAAEIKVTPSPSSQDSTKSKQPPQVYSYVVTEKDAAGKVIHTYEVKTFSSPAQAMDPKEVQEFVQNMQKRQEAFQHNMQQLVQQAIKSFNDDPFFKDISQQK